MYLRAGLRRGRPRPRLLLDARDDALAVRAERRVGAVGDEELAFARGEINARGGGPELAGPCLLYTSDAADE